MSLGSSPGLFVLTPHLAAGMFTERWRVGKPGAGHVAGAGIDKMIAYLFCRYFHFLRPFDQAATVRVAIHCTGNCDGRYKCAGKQDASVPQW